jgi:hypothetical protein
VAKKISDRLAADNLDRLRRHHQRSVVAEQRGEGRDFARLPGAHECVQHQLFAAAERA